MKQFNKQKLQNKLRNKFLKSGVKIIGPETIYFSEDTKIGKNVTIEPYVVFGSKVKIGNRVTIKSFSHLENCKIDNSIYQGFAFGMGLDRITMLKHGLTDIRSFFNANLNWINQNGFGLGDY